MSLLNGHDPVPLETARALLGERIRSVPVRYMAKTVTRDGWINERWEEADLERQFGGQVNLGVLLGEPSERLADCDLDTREAVAAAPYFLPPTNMVWGRAGKLDSHWAYRIDVLVGHRNIPFKDPLIKKTDADAERRAMLCELRVKGQTIGPGSIHPSGELVNWSRATRAAASIAPATLPYEALKASLGRVAASALLARYWAEGIRHDATLPLAGLLCRGGMDENQACHFVRVVCIVAGEEEADIANRVAAVSDTYRRAERGEHFTAGATLEEFFDPKVVMRLRDWLGLTKLAYGGDVGPDGLPLSDVGNAERFIAKWGGRVLYCDDEKAWYLWNERRWERDRANAIYRRAIEVVDEFRQLANATTTVSKGNTTPEQWKKHSDKFGAAKTIRAMLDLAASFAPVVPEEFDADPLLLNVQNGTLELNLRTGEAYLREFRADDRLTMLAAVPYVPDARSDVFEAYLGRFFPEAERRAFLAEHGGYVLSGLPKRYALELIGFTNSGKSLTLDLFGKVLGDYASTLHYSSLAATGKGGGGGPRADLWRVRNKRLVTIAEIPADTPYDVALFKTLLSGGDRLNVRTLYDRTGGADIQFAFALWTSGNRPYGPPSNEDAAYERLHVLRCDHQVPKEERSERGQVETLDMSVTGAACLAFMVRGFTLRVLRGGELIPPDFVARETRQLQDDLNDWTEVIAELFELTEDADDAVLKTEAWAMASALHSGGGGYGAKKSGRKDQWDFEATLERKVGKSHRSKARWDNKEAWWGLKWREDVVRDYPHLTTET